MAQASKDPGQAKDLQQLKGIGRVLAQRLHGAGISSYEDVVEAGEEGLKRIAGIRPHSLSSILDQAKVLSEGKKAAKAERAEAMKGRIASVREKVERLAEVTGIRFPEELAAKPGKKLSAELEGVREALARLEGSALKRLKRAGRGLDKVEKRMEGLEDASLRKVRKAMKKSRKAVLKSLP